MFPANQILNTYMYREIYENSYSIDKPDYIPPGKIIFAEACYIRQFFQTLKNHPERKVIVISGESDFGIHYQDEYPSNADVFKAYYRVHWNEVAEAKYYTQINLKACKPENCTFTDNFAAKIDGMTDCTFDKIPDNVHWWFCCNSMINEPRVEFLPFGVNTYGDLALFEEFYKGKNEGARKLLYVNFDINTFDRYELKNYWMNYIKQPRVNEWATFINDAKPVKEFYQDILNHEYVLSPAGNGRDGYRNYESLYLGRIPIVPYTRWSRSMLEAGFPIMIVNNIYATDQTFLQNILNEARKCYDNFDKRILTKDYWFDKIWAKAKEI